MKNFYSPMLVILFFGFFCTSNAQVFQVYNSSNSTLPNNIYWYVKVTGENELYASSWGGGLVKMNVSGAIQNVYNSSNTPLTTNQITCTIMGAGDLLYAGTDPGGLLKRVNGSWSLLTNSNSGLSGNTIYALEYDKLGGLWIGTRYNSITVLNQNGSYTYHNNINSTLGNFPIYSLSSDNIGNMWVGTGFGGLHVRTASSWTVYNTSNSILPSNDIYALAVDANNTIWVGTYNGLVRIDGTNWTVYNNLNSGLPHNYIRQIKIDANQNIWIATDGGGIAMFDRSSWGVYNTSNSNLPLNRIYSLDIDRSNILWVGTYGGGIAKMIQPTSVSEYSKVPVINVYPNPTNEFIIVENSSNFETDLTVSILDIMGTIILREEHNEFNYTNDGFIKIDVKGFRKGIYILNVSNKSINQSKKIIIN